MDVEKINEINKSFAFGFPAEQVSTIENISLAEAEQIMYDNADEIALQKEYFTQMGRI